MNFFGGFSFFRGIVGDFDFVDDVDFFNLPFVLFLVVFVECSATDYGVGRCVSLNFILLGFDDA